MIFSQLPIATLSPILLLLTLSNAAGQSAADLYRITDGVTQSRTEFHQVALPMGREHILADLRGPGKVTYFYITDDSVGKWNPGLVLKVYWDDATEPAIRVPLADFFGAVAGRSVDYQSAVMQINHACFMCYLPMPFSKRARFILTNDGDHNYSRKVAYGIDHEQSREIAKEKSRLYCEWRRSNPVTNGLHTLLDVRGRGQYIGSILQAVSRDQKTWFGEGDTIFNLDGKTFAHTPGTEDEYGSCWEDPSWRTFSALYCGHLLNQDGINRMYRWYVTNPVRFQKGLKVEIQNQHENGTPTTSVDSDDYTTLAFWYQEGSQKAARLPSFKERTASSFPDKR